MRDYGRVYSRFWTSSDVQALSDDGRLLALYLLSGPHGTIAGVCRLPIGYVCEDLKWPQKRVSKGFHELFRKGFANRCETTDWVWICRFLTWNTPENPNQWKAARKIAQSVPAECSWIAAFHRVFAIAAGEEPPPSSNGSGTVVEPLPTQEQEQEQYQEQEQEGEGNGTLQARAKRSPPTRIPDDFIFTEERRDYAIAKGIDPDPTFEAFCAYWRSKPKDNTKLDWDATWHSWVLKDAKDQKIRAAPRKTRFQEIEDMRRGH